MRLPILWKNLNLGFRLLQPLRGAHISYPVSPFQTRLFNWLPEDLESKFTSYKSSLIDEYNVLTDTITGSRDGKHMKDSISRWEKLRPIVDVFEELDVLVETDEDIEHLFKDVMKGDDIDGDNEDAEMMEMIHIEKKQRASHREALETKLLNLLVPDDPIALTPGARIELLAGAGGREAGLFACQLLDMYRQLASERGWQFRLLHQSTLSCNDETNGLSSDGPLARVQVEIVGDSSEGESESFQRLGAYGQLRWEAGVHRVQRVPVTSKLNKIHTSTVAVSVLPTTDEISVHLPDSDLKWEYYRSSGAGGQHVNRTESAVRLTHLPTGTVVTCQRERSQHTNRRIALHALHEKLLQTQLQTQSDSESSWRQAQIGSMDRSEKIRTYNFPQDRVTDHRLSRSWSGIQRFMRQTQSLSEAMQSLYDLDRLNRLRQILSEHVEKD